MKLKNSSKYVIKVWSTTLVLGSIVSLSLMATLTSYANEIQNVFQLLGYSLMFIVIGTLVSSPLALIFYTTFEVMLLRRLPVQLLKVLLSITGCGLTLIFFIILSGQDYTMLWAYTSFTIIFYSFLTVLVIAVFAYRINP